jgi:Protein of unknown function (DUF3761)
MKKGLVSLAAILGLSTVGLIGLANSNQQDALTAVSSPSPAAVQAAAPATPVATPTPTPAPTTTLSNNDYYSNSDGNEVHSPAYTDDDSVPAGATAQCADGTYSFSQHHSGTCSHHGGVATWL